MDICTFESNTFVLQLFSMSSTYLIRKFEYGRSLGVEGGIDASKLAPILSRQETVDNLSDETLILGLYIWRMLFLTSLGSLQARIYSCI